MGAVDLFSGSRGWDVGARMAGLDDALGIDMDAAACATSVAAGFPTLCADVSELDPLGFAPCEVLIASPPCQAWSMAGKRQGQEDIAHVYEAARALAGGEAMTGREWADPRSRLVLEPLRWALALRPRWMAWEQVPPVIEFWQFCARLLRAEGYNVWTGVLSAERYGVPQTRRRAILMASLDGPVRPPAPTHQAYVKGEPAQFRHTFEGDLEPWVSMEDALGWGMTERPAYTVTGGGTGSGGGVEVFGSSDTREAMRRERMRGAWELRGAQVHNGKQATRTERAASEPALTVAANADRWRWLRNNSNANASRRRSDEPAPTLFFGYSMNEVGFVSDPDQRVNDGGEPITLEEAAALQGFPAGHGFCGPRTAQFRQVGDAVPPPLAAAVLTALIPASERSLTATAPPSEDAA